MYPKAPPWPHSKLSAPLQLAATVWVEKGASILRLPLQANARRVQELRTWGKRQAPGALCA
eukprot:8121781-Pyramimonas_sp.AAC.1